MFLKKKKIFRPAAGEDVRCGSTCLIRTPTA